MRISKKIAPPLWAIQKEVSDLMRIMNSGGLISRFVGGAVRDCVLDIPARDVDIATTGNAVDNLQKLGRSGFVVHPTGLKHGTITAVVNHQGFEITTLRRDLETDGRHAKIAATDDWLVDAQRRDLTMNALYMDLDGSLYDPVGGYDDIIARRVRFIGNPERRLAEDHLRILRFFRFYAWYGSGGLDQDGLAACSAAASHIDNLSKERITQEMLKLLSAPDPIPALEAMQATGVLLATLEMPVDFASLRRTISAEKVGGFSVDPLRRLAGLYPDGNSTWFEIRLRLSKHQRLRLQALMGEFGQLPLAGDGNAIRAAVYQQGRGNLRDRYLLAGNVELAQYSENISIKDFPLRGRDLLQIGMTAGPEVGVMLGEIENWWLERGTEPNRNECIAELNHRISILGRSRKP